MTDGETHRPVGLYSDTYGGATTIDPTVVHPTAATPLLHNHYAAPFLFLVTGLPEDFREWLVTTGIHEVNSHLNFLFVENGAPIPHDYVVTLTNYNMRTETELLRERAHGRVKRSVIDMLFNVPSDTSKRIADYIAKFRDNLDETLSNDEARLFIRNSISVSSLDVIVPGTKDSATVYNIYIHPPTAIPNPLDVWRKFIAAQRYYADEYGMGVKYKFPWRCLHCKTIDHPSGLCSITRSIKEKKGKQRETITEAEELLPLEPTPGPSRQPQNPNHGKRGNRKAMSNAPPRRSGEQNRTNAVRTAGSKKQKMN